MYNIISSSLNSSNTLQENPIINHHYNFTGTPTMALVPPASTNEAVARLDCRTAPSKSEGKQLSNNFHQTSNIHHIQALHDHSIYLSH